ncbi:MAG: YifB family Mg chelatase-like AAA ATPase [Clostridia bacterium]|nr:YifB family Mg chelatase-like AAA ATPase [Clostridia bacterium]
MVTTTMTAALSGLDGFAVTVESFSAKGSLPTIEIIGLPDTSVKEALERIHAACAANDLPFHKGRTTINLAPADRKKVGSSYDLAILLSLLKQNVLSEIDLTKKCFIGELSLSGEVRACRGALPLSLAALKAGCTEIYVPACVAREAAVVQGITVYGVSHIKELLAHLSGDAPLSPTPFEGVEAAERARPAVDFADIRAQSLAKRALEIAAAGNHNVLLIGPPGSGKSLLANAMCSILPEMTFEEMVEATKIYSVSGLLHEGEALITTRPFRSPHHTTSPAGLAGGGTIPAPGEISLASGGVLFLDELPEFDKRALQILRQPMEEHTVTVTRVGGKLTFPADFMLVCAMNPCPCGYYGSPDHVCTCTPAAIERYQAKISGPLLDRIDLQIEVPAVTFGEITAGRDAMTSESVRKRVNAARKFAARRLKSVGATSNGRLTGEETKQLCVYTDEAREILSQAFERLGLSARGYDRILRVARTIADLEESELIEAPHILEAIQLRALDRKYFEH